MDVRGCGGLLDGRVRSDDLMVKPCAKPQTEANMGWKDIKSPEQVREEKIRRKEKARAAYETMMEMGATEADLY